MKLSIKDIDMLLHFAACEYHVSIEDIRSENKANRLPDCRLILMRILSNYELTQEEIGLAINTSRSNISVRLPIFDNLLQTDNKFKIKHSNILEQWSKYIIDASLEKVNLLEMLNQLNFLTLQVKTLIKQENEFLKRKPIKGNWVKSK